MTRRPYDGTVSSPPRPQPWHSLPCSALLESLHSRITGLSDAEAAHLLETHGPNEIREAPPVHPALLFLRQFRSLIVGILIVAAIVSLFLGEKVDAAAILAIVVLNALMGFYQEYQAEQSISALRRMTAPKAHVRRSGQLKTIDASQLVPGDILELDTGDSVAADARIAEATALRTVESALTGESESVLKTGQAELELETPLAERANMVFKGTHVAEGRAVVLVVATGMHTELGKIASLIQSGDAGQQTPLQEKLTAFGRWLVWGSLGVVGLLFAIGLYRGLPWLEMFMVSVSLAVAAVPEGLPAVVTLALALGVMRMARQRALVRTLPSVETLGCTSVVCTDKTGTLTVGDMTVRELFVDGQSYEVTGEGYGPHGEIRIQGRKSGSEHAAPLLELATTLLACNNAQLVLDQGAWQVIGDPTEGALLVAGTKAGANVEHINQSSPRHHEIPFDSDRKRRTVIRRRAQGGLRAHINGASDVLLSKCTRIYTERGVAPLTEEHRSALRNANERMASQGLRVLGSAYRDLPETMTILDADEMTGRDLVFVGLSGMYDPPRPEAAAAITQCHQAGIRVIMITGDHPQTARAIARELNLMEPSTRVLSGAELDRMSEAELIDACPAISVYARVTAEHKLRIVQAWRARGCVVAMTGDGVNDAPALKASHVGIAMGIKGTEVTKQAADMVITDDRFSSIVAAVEQGRGVYENIRKTLQYLLAGNTAELFLMTAAVALDLPAPLLPVHLLWINLVTDGLPALCLASDPLGPNLMSRPPRAPSESLTDRAFLRSVLIAGAITGAVCLAFYAWTLRHQSLEAARSMTFTALVFCELFKAFSFRDPTLPFWKLPWAGHVRLGTLVMASVLLQILLHHVPFLGNLLKTVTPEWTDRWILLMIGLIPLMILEALKLISREPNPSGREVSNTL